MIVKHYPRERSATPPSRGTGKAGDLQRPETRVYSLRPANDNVIPGVEWAKRTAGVLVLFGLISLAAWISIAP